MNSSLRLVLPLALAAGVIGSYYMTRPEHEAEAVMESTTSDRGAAFKKISDTAGLHAAGAPAGAVLAGTAAAAATGNADATGAGAGGTPEPVRWQPAHAGIARAVTKADAGPSLSAAPLPPDFLEKIVDASGSTARFSLPDGSSAVGTVELIKSDSQGVVSVQGKLSSPAAGFYFFQRQTVSGPAGTMVGNVRFNEGVRAWRVDPTGPDGAPMLNAVSIDQVVCVGNPLPKDVGSTTTTPTTTTTPGTGDADSGGGLLADNASSGTAVTNPAPNSSPAPNTSAADTTSASDPGTPQYVPQTHPTNMSFPAAVNGVVPLQSLPGAAGVIYLDFDGEPGPFSGWSVDGDALASGASNTQIKEVWQRVAEDFQPFSINVTTDRRVFDAATETSRKHVIITPTTDAAPGAGGVAYVGSWNNSGNTVCWVFILTGKSCAEAISHEVGHTLGLSHDGRNSPAEGYYAGHGSGDVGWAPIMGVGYYENLSQWSKGEYASANNTEDDLNIIVSNNNAVDYRADDTTALYATADYLDILSTFAVSNEGILETRTDVDAWRFQTIGGAVSLTVSTVNAGPNADLLAEIYNSSNVLIASNNPDATLNGTLSATLPAGDYTLRVSGVGRGTATADGYSDYGSLGAYLITGSITNGVRHDRFTINENVPAATPVGTVTPRLAHGTNALTYNITSGNTGGAFSINAATGQLIVASPAALNYETLSTRWDDPANFELFVTVTDSVVPALNETLRVVVIVNNLNEAPTVTGGAITVFTNTREGTPIFKVTGSDPDRFDYPLFSIAAGNTGSAFAIDANTGQITATAGFPTTVPAAPMALTIRATDRATPALTTDSTVTVTVLAAPAGYIPGGLTRTYFENITGNLVSNLTGNAKYPNNPDSEEFQTVFDAAEHGSNFGSTARAWLLPPATGNYTFWIASDDASVLRISTNATPASAVQRASSASATGRYEYTKNASQQSAVIALTAGVPYYIEAQHKEGTGADHLVVAWQGPGFSRQVIGGCHLVPYLQNYAPRIPAQSFTVRRNSDIGTPLGTVNVTEINPQNVPGSFTITGGTAGPWCAIDANTGEISISSPAFLAVATGNSHTLTVRVADDANPALTGTGTITLNILDPGALQITGIEQQIWTGISGNNVSALTADARYPNRPTETRILTGFDSGADYAESYGSRIRAWVIPPATGVYNFYIAGDDESQLRFTTGTNYATAAQFAYTTNASGREAWTANATQKSAAIALTAGQRYYIETRHKEGVGGDYIQVAWTGPGITTPTIIPASALAPFDYNTAPAWPAAPYAFTVKQGTPNGTLVGTVAATDADSPRLIFNITGGNTGGALALNPYTGSLTVANKAALLPGTTLTLSLRVQDDGINSRYPFKTAATTAVVTIPRDFVIASPVSRSVNLPAGTGLEIEALGSGRAGATVAWSMVSGPGTVTFDAPTALLTGATFSAPGVYVIRGTETASGVPLVQDLTVQSAAATALPGGERIGVQSSVPGHTWSGGVWQLSAGGTGLGTTTADSLYFINQPTGNAVTITARITAIQNVNGHNSIAGLMIRESAAADARSFFCGLTSQNGRRIILRTTAGLPAEIATADNTAAATPFVPTWVRITRSGSVFTAFTAPDVAGAPGTFTALGTSQSFPMASASFVGLAAGSGISATRGTSSIDNLNITPSQANLAPAVNATGPATLNLAASATLDGTVSDDARPAAPGAVTPLWKKIAGPGTVTFATANAADTSASFSSTGTYQLRLTADDGDTRSFRELSVSVGSSPIETWRAAKFTTLPMDPLTSGDLADPDKDGMVNLLEYALGREPLTAENTAPVPTLTFPAGGPFLRLSFAKNPAATDVTLTVETTITPQLAGSWSTTGTVVETNTADTLTVRTATSINAQPAQFLRLRVVR